MGDQVIDQVCRILARAGEPLHYADIADRLIGQGLWVPDSDDPERYLDAIICQHIATDPVHARIRRFDWGLYELNAPHVARLDPPNNRGYLAWRQRSQTTLAPVIIGTPDCSSLLNAAITVLQKAGRGRALWHFDIANRALSLNLVDGEPRALSLRIASELDAEIQRQQAWKDSAPLGRYLVLQKLGHRCYTLVVWHKTQWSEVRLTHEPSAKQPGRSRHQNPTRLQRRSAKKECTQAANSSQPTVSGEVPQTIPSTEPEPPKVWDPQLFPDIAERVLRQSARKQPMHLGEIAAKALELGLMPRLTKPDLKECALQLFLEWVGKSNNTGSGRFMLVGARLVGLSEWVQG